MPKKKHVLFIRAYEKNDPDFSEIRLSDYSIDRLYSIYLEFVELLLQGKFNSIYRIELVSGGRVLFMCCSLRSFVDQKNLTININPI